MRNLGFKKILRCHFFSSSVYLATEDSRGLDTEGQQIGGSAYPSPLCIHYTLQDRNDNQLIRVQWRTTKMFGSWSSCSLRRC